MFLRILVMTVLLLFAVSTASAGVIISQESFLGEMTMSSCDFDSSDSPEKEIPMVREGQSQGMSATSTSSAKTSNPQALEDSFQLVLPKFKPRRTIAFENAVLPASPVLDGLLKPS